MDNEITPPSSSLESLATALDTLMQKNGDTSAKLVVPILEKIERNTRLLGGVSPFSPAQRRQDGQSPEILGAPLPPRKTAPASVKKERQFVQSGEKSVAEAVSKGAEKGVTAAMTRGISEQPRAAQRSVRDASSEQKKNNAAFLAGQERQVVKPKSAEALQSRRQEQDAKSGGQQDSWIKKTLASGVGFLGRGAMETAKTEGVKDLAGAATVGGPVWGSLKEISEVAGSAAESLGKLRKKTDETTKGTGGKPEKGKGTPKRAVRDDSGRFARAQDKKEEGRNRSLLQTIRRIRPGSVVRSEDNGGGGGILDTVDNALDIWGNVKKSKWGQKAGGVLGKGAKLGKGLIGKGLGLLGIGGAGLAGAAEVAGATGATSAALGGAATAGVGGKIAGKLGARAIPGIGQALAVGMAAWDGYQGWNDKDLHQKAFGTKQGEEATTGQKTAAAAANILDMGGLTSMGLGMLGVQTDSASMARSMYNGIKDLVDSVDKNSKTEKENSSWLSKLFSGDSWLGKIFGFGGDKGKEPPKPVVTTAKELSDSSFPSGKPGEPQKDFGLQKDVIVPASKTSTFLEQAGRKSSLPPGLTSPIQTKGNTSGIGSLSAKYESAGKSDTVAYDQRGGTSYGKYQIASAPGTADKFLKYLDTASPEAAQRLRAAGPLNTGGKDGAAPQEWKKLVSEGKITDEMQHDFIKQTHYDPAFKNLSPEAQAKVNGSKTLQDMLWSRAVSSPGNATKDFNAAIAEQQSKGFDDNALVDNIYDRRLSRAQNSPDSKKGLTNRFGTSAMSERNAAKRMLAEESSSKDAQTGASLAGIGTSGKPTTPGTPAPALAQGSDALDATTLNMPVKTAQGIKTPAQMGIKTYSELQQKGGQAFAGGHNDAATTFMTSQIMKETGASYLSAQNDAYHQQNAPTSGHTKGVKTDFSYAGLSNEGYKGKHKEISSMLSSKYGMEEGKDFQIISDPHGTGKHIDFKLTQAGQKKAETARLASLAKEQGDQNTQVADKANPTPATPASENTPAGQQVQVAETKPAVEGNSFYDKNSKMTVLQQAQIASLQNRVDEAKKSGDDTKAAKYQSLLDSKRKDFGAPAETPQAAEVAKASQPSQEAQSATSLASSRPATVAQKDLRAPESAAEIKAKTPPPPMADNSGIERRLDEMTRQQTLWQQAQNKDTESQSTPNIPFEFDDYTLQTWAHDRA